MRSDWTHDPRIAVKPVFSLNQLFVAIDLQTLEHFVAEIAAILSNSLVAMPYELRKRRNRASVLDLSAGVSDEDEDDENADEPMTAEDLDFLDDRHVDEGNLHRELDVRLSIRDESVDKRAQKLTKARKAKEALKKTRTELAAALAASVARVTGAESEAAGDAIAIDSIVGSGPEEPPAPAVRRGRMTNAQKVHLSEFHPELTCWSCNHTRSHGDVHPALTIEAWEAWLDKCERGIGRLERGDGEDQLHLQAWYETYCGVDASAITAMKAAFKEHFSCVPTKDFKSATNPFKGNQKIKYMTGYVGKTLAKMAQEPGTSIMFFKGAEFTEDNIQECIADYETNCPKDPNGKRTTFSRNNVMLYALNFKNRFLEHIIPVPSLGRTLQIMIISKKYIPASNFNAQGYPLDRQRAEEMWLLLNDPDLATQNRVCKALFAKNDTDTFNGTWNQMQNLPYNDGTSWEDYIQLNRQMNPAVDSDVVDNLLEDDAGVDEL